MDALKSAIAPLKPITNALPQPVHDLGTSIIGSTCYKTLILDLDPTDTECVKLAISKGLGIGIIGASSIVKVPQIIKLVNSRSASGVSFLSYLLETSSYLISLAYNFRNEFPFSTYGETALIMGQNVIITILVLNYSGKQSTAALFVAVLAAAAFSLFAENLVDMKTLGLLQAGAGVLGVGSKIPQILAIYQQGGTGQLSAFTVGFPKATCLCYGFCKHQRLTRLLGLQLPRRLPFSNLHHSARGRRQADSVRIHCWFCSEPGPGPADGLLLERTLGQGSGQDEGDPHCCCPGVL